MDTEIHYNVWQNQDIFMFFERNDSFCLPSITHLINQNKMQLLLLFEITGLFLDILKLNFNSDDKVLFSEAIAPVY